MITKQTVRGSFPVKSLGEVADFLDSKRRPIKEADRRPGPYPYYGANGQQGTIDGYIFDEPLILLAEDGGFFDAPERGIAYRISGKSWVNNHAHIIKPRNGLDLAFLCRVLENYDVTPFISGSTRAKLTKGQAEQIEIPIPPLEEQKRIAGILDQADELRRLRQRAVDRLNELGQAIFNEMFGDLAKIPIVPLRELVDEFRYGTSNKSADKGYPALRIPNIIGGALNLDDVKLVPVENAELQRLRLKAGDVLFVRTNGNPDYVGRCAIFDPDRTISAGYDRNNWIYASYLIRARLNETQLNPVFLCEFLSTLQGRRLLRERSKTSAGQFNINTESLGSIPVPVPALKRQVEFASKIHTTSLEKTFYLQSIAYFGKLFSSLQHRAFLGQL